MMRYENAPGKVGKPPLEWPETSRIPRSVEQPTLLMILHPHCPCSHASLDELARLIAQSQGQARAYVVFSKPRDIETGLENSSLWRTAARIPGVATIVDDGAVEADRFGANTSGHTLLFNAAGKLLFSGGITASRGHSGDNAGRSAVVSLLKSGRSQRSASFVFGCSVSDIGKEQNQ